ncbi:PPR32 phosphatase, partial [Bucorvus abyssinicus]|nr:PPR32 phosphatase [Bucorvus abyssinicus]
MASARLFVCPPGKLRSLPQELATSSGGSADLMNFYATTYAVAYGQPWFRPCLGHRTSTGYVANNLLAISHLLCPRSAAEGHCQDTVTSTTAEDFKPLWVPDGRSLLPRHIHQPGSGYHQECAPSCLHPRGDSPQHTGLLQGPPKAAGRHSTKSHCTSPVLPDLLQKTTVGTKEQSGFTRARPRSNVVLPGQPVSPHPPGGHTCPSHPISILWQGGETLPVLPVGSKRGSGFTQEAPSSLGMTV